MTIYGGIFNKIIIAVFFFVALFWSILFEDEKGDDLDERYDSKDYE